MDHIAILKRSLIKKGNNLLEQILEGKKTIESRWYVNKVAPYGQIETGDVIYLKESGCPVTAKVEVEKVLYFEKPQAAALSLFDGNTKVLPLNIKKIIRTYGRQISPNTSEADFIKWAEQKQKLNYCILIFLKNPVKIEPFEISKKGFGISSAWMAVKDIARVRIRKT